MQSTRFVMLNKKEGESTERILRRHQERYEWPLFIQHVFFQFRKKKKHFWPSQFYFGRHPFRLFSQKAVVRPLRIHILQAEGDTQPCLVRSLTNSIPSSEWPRSQWQAGGKGVKENRYEGFSLSKETSARGNLKGGDDKLRFNGDVLLREREKNRSFNGDVLPTSKWREIIALD